MESANLELVSSILNAWGRGDYSSANWAHPDIEFVRIGGPSPGTWTGLTGMAAATRDWLSAWEDSRVEVDECRELDDERVLALTRISGRGRASGLELEQMATKGAHVFYLRGGKVIRYVHYLDRERALAELGLV